MTKNIINIGLPSKGRLKRDTINIFKKNKINVIVGKEFFPLNKRDNKNLKIEFSAANSREVELYSSMIFSIDVRIKSKLYNFITGGRYDELTSNLGFKKIPAVGAAINMNLL